MWEPFQHGYRHKNGGKKNLIIMLHGMYIGQETGAGALYRDEISEKGKELLSLPDTHLYVPESKAYMGDQVWDYTGFYSYGLDAIAIIDVILELNDDYDTVCLHGGSAGGIMAWDVLEKLYDMGKDDLIAAISMFDVVAPSALYMNEQKPIGRYEYTFHNTNYGSKQKLIGIETRIFKPILLAMSTEDAILKDQFKYQFAYEMGAVVEHMKFIITGTAHDVGQAGWNAMGQWYKELIEGEVE